ncbi:MAG TPA: class II aldolase/adducin family protein [Caulobacteraceae bacterium]|jgi:L-fuculose-phosphate aldolase|nr:class II aldolase/adducin family protein [Caulobacteraceae bacterium]
MDQAETELRTQLVHIMKAMDARGLNRGTSGNASVRHGEDMLITPTGVPPDQLHVEQVVQVRADGTWASEGARPSSEWQMHSQILLRRPDINAVVHCHSRHATILACAGRQIPSMHYMVGVSGGSSVPVAPYATFGSVELADATVDALGGRFAALLANHGQIAIARTLHRALSIAEEIEEQAAIYWGTLAIGGPNLLDEAEMARVLAKFRTYGQQGRGKE